MDVSPGDDFITLETLSDDDLYSLIELTGEMKESPPMDHPLRDKQLAMVFQKRSTRTRVSFEVGMNQLGGDAVFLSEDDLQLGRGESIADTSRALSRYVDCIMARVYGHSDVEKLARHSSVPVINGLSNYNHPCQALSDLFTITEEKQDLDGLTLAWLGDGNNVCHSLLNSAPKLGVDMRIATPKRFRPDEGVVDSAIETGRNYGAEVMLTSNPVEAVDGADIVYTDSWISMGDSDKDLDMFTEYQVDAELMENTSSDCIFMHCLPAHRGEEVTDDVIDADYSVVWNQAENRLHTQKTVISKLVR